MSKIANIVDVVFSPDFQHFSNIQHWNGTPRNSPISLPHHSWWVSMLTNLICIELNVDDSLRLRCVNYALFHDLDEMFTGDVMHPFKYNGLNGVDIRSSIEDYVFYISNRTFDSKTSVGNHLFNVSSVKPDGEIKCIVKLADNLSLLNYCLTEVMSGNRFFDTHMNKCLQLIDSSCNQIMIIFPDKKEEVLQILSQVQNKVNNYGKN